ncbi:MAG TPA: hypothetical protein ENK93_03300, partial [Campylobacteraceae bacterium]|nr:hypothetical protein [Campylobacteraceae bacterium]
MGFMTKISAVCHKLCYDLIRNSCNIVTEEKDLMREEQLPLVAVAGINDAHLEEMLIINRLEEAAERNDTETVSQILGSLLEHTRSHFQEEEKRMEGSGYPAIREHKSEHERHLRELGFLQKHFDTHKDTKAIDVYIKGNLVAWFIH